MEDEGLQYPSTPQEGAAFYAYKDTLYAYGHYV